MTLSQSFPVCKDYCYQHLQMWIEDSPFLDMTKTRIWFWSHQIKKYPPVPSRKTPPAPPLLAVTGERAPERNVTLNTFSTYLEICQDLAYHARYIKWVSHLQSNDSWPPPVWSPTRANDEDLDIVLDHLWFRTHSTYTINLWTRCKKMWTLKNWKALGVFEPELLLLKQPWS